MESEARLPPGAMAVEAGITGSGYAGLVLERLARHTCRIAGVNWACLFVRDRTDPRLVIAAAGHGVGWDLIGSRFAADEGVVGTILMSGKAALLDDFRDLAGPVAGEGDEVRAGAAVPIRLGRSVKGVLAAARTGSAQAFDESDFDLLADLAELASAALGHSQADDQTDAAVYAHVRALSAAMSMRDRETASHSEDVVALARRVGELLRLERASLLELEFAARLHDVGKIQVPDAILNKPGPLDGEESTLIRCHAAWGSDTLSRIPGLEAVASIVRFHHERWDGGGYPDGLKGARIPLASRIISACDAYGAMTSDRPYRRAMAASRAIDELRRGSGTQFDPAVVEALVEAVTVLAR
ncbi:MAG: hypothetical protein NVSMB25_06020 [Thermoleophilaceae bacterium]